MHTDKKYACLNSIKFGIDIMDISHMYALIMCLNSINFAMISTMRRDKYQKWN